MTQRSHYKRETNSGRTASSNIILNPSSMSLSMMPSSLPGRIAYAPQTIVSHSSVKFHIYEWLRYALARSLMESSLHKSDAYVTTIFSIHFDKLFFPRILNGKRNWCGGLNEIHFLIFCVFLPFLCSHSARLKTVTIMSSIWKSDILRWDRFSERLKVAWLSPELNETISRSFEAWNWRVFNWEFLHLIELLRGGWHLDEIELNFPPKTSWHQCKALFDLPQIDSRRLISVPKSKVKICCKTTIINETTICWCRNQVAYNFVRSLTITTLTYSNSDIYASNCRTSHHCNVSNGHLPNESATQRQINSEKREGESQTAMKLQFFCCFYSHHRRSNNRMHQHVVTPNERTNGHQKSTLLSSHCSRRSIEIECGLSCILV